MMTVSRRSVTHDAERMLCVFYKNAHEGTKISEHMGL